MIETAKTLFLSLWTPSRVTLRTPLSVSECIGRLQAELGTGLFMGGSGPVVGRAREDQATLRRQIFYGNSFATVLNARLVPTGAGGVEIRCLSRGSGYVRGFMSLWLGFIALWWVGATLAVIVNPMPLGFLFVLFPIPMIAFGVGFVVFCRYLARNDEAVILAWLRDRMEAQ